MKFVFLCKPVLGILLLFSFLSGAAARDHVVNDVAEFQHAVKAVQPGDSILLREGEWKDADLLFQAKGTRDDLITLRAVVPGKTILTGKSTLRIAGEYLVVSGLYFRDSAPDAGELIQFRKDSKQAAHHCRVTQCAITLAPAAIDLKQSVSRWVNLYGSNNRVDHCLLQGKNNIGTTLVVWLGQGNDGGHRIDHNYFGSRERLGKNGAETIRVGDSSNSMQSAHCIVEDNLFEHCNGEAECISNKSCDNIYRNNTFIAVSGTLTLRHGNRCLVEGNIFLGQKAKGTGGVRIIGEEHIVRNNYFKDLTGDEARSALCIMNGIPNSKLHEYFPVKKAMVEGNTLVNCTHSLWIGYNDMKSATQPPVETLVKNNQILAEDRTVITVADATQSIAGIQWEGNIFFGKELGISMRKGIDWHKPEDLSLPKPLDRAEVGPEWFMQAASEHDL